MQGPAEAGLDLCLIAVGRPTDLLPTFPGPLDSMVSSLAFVAIVRARWIIVGGGFWPIRGGPIVCLPVLV